MSSLQQNGHNYFPHPNQQTPEKGSMPKNLSAFYGKTVTHWKFKSRCGMNGNKMLLDTNAILSLLDGNSHLGIVLQGIEPYVSFVSELELLGHKYISRESQECVELFLADCNIIDLNDGIKEMTRYIQWEYSLKLPDALIVATAMSLGIPLFSAEHHFERVKELIFVLYQS
jgi:predicted nucleic acid-binding protein